MATKAKGFKIRRRVYFSRRGRLQSRDVVRRGSSHVNSLRASASSAREVRRAFADGGDEKCMRVGLFRPSFFGRLPGPYFRGIMRRSKYNGRAKGVNCNKPLRRENPSGDDEDREPGKSGERRERPPPGLRGKSLGLWYRQRQIERQKRPPERERTATLALERDKIDEIEELLSGAGCVVSDFGERDVPEKETFKKMFLRTRNVSFEEKLNELQTATITRDEALDEELYSEWVQKTSHSEEYKRMLAFRQALPSFQRRSEIIDIIDKNQIVVISGETGCGKTTQVVQFVLDDYVSRRKGSLFEAVCTQPRRISAISVAERVAAERAERLGISVGYVIRLIREPPKRRKGKLTFVTTGMLIQWLQKDPLLSGVSHLFVDEIHERDTLSDFLLTLLKFILPKRPDLRVILMSATLNSEKFSDYFGGVPCLKIPGFTYPVEEFYLEDVLEKVPFRFPQPKFAGYGRRKTVDAVFQNYVVPYVNDLERNQKISKSVAMMLKNPVSESLNMDLIARTIFYICNHEPEGAILVFVPGLVQIQDLHKLLSDNKYFSSRAMIVPMHSIITTASQKKAFSTPPRGVRKIIISTSICETSITIDDVRYVIDCGKQKLKSFDLNKNVDTLEPEWESLANATQRKGRAGRTHSGKCYKLFTRAREQTFELYPLPDIQRCRLEEVILNAKTLQLGRVEPFLQKLMDPPDLKGVELSLKLLRTLNLLDDEERLTPLGYHVAKLPLDPQNGKLILMGALFSCLDPVLSVAACLSFKDPFEYVFGKEDVLQKKRDQFSEGEKSDHFTFSNALISWEEAQKRGDGYKFAYDNFLSNHNLHLLSSMKKQFANYLFEMKFLASPDPKDPRSNSNSGNTSLIKAIVCSGLYPNVAMIKKVIKSKTRNENKLVIWKTVDHPRAEFHRKSVLTRIKNFESPFVVYFEKMKSSAIFLHDGTMVYPMALVFFGERCDIVEDGGYYVRVDDMIKFSCTKRTATLIQKLRKQLLWILEQAVSNPGAVDWKVDNRKMLILNVIVELITSEDKTSMDEHGIEFHTE